MTPEGISYGRAMIRPIVSAMTNVLPPAMAATGIRNACSALNIRTACGMTSPINPIMPVTATVMLVINEAIQYKSSICVWIPWVAAKCVPNEMISSWR